MPEDGGEAVRLTPEMASFGALVLDFVRAYIERWGQSPSYGEIAAGTGSNPTRAKRAVRSLARAGLLIRTPGTRGLALPDEVQRARLVLERAGLLSGDGRSGVPVPKSTLLPPPTLDYSAPVSDADREQRRDGNSTDR